MHKEWIHKALTFKLRLKALNSFLPLLNLQVREKYTYILKLSFCRNSNILLYMHPAAFNAFMRSVQLLRHSNTYKF